MSFRNASNKPGSSLKAIFEDAFNMHFDSLYRYAFTILQNAEEAKDTVQSVFLNWWEKKNGIIVEQSVKAYLFSAVYKRSLNVIRHRKIKEKYKKNFLRISEPADNNGEQLFKTKELDMKIRTAIDSLPVQCKAIFSKSRFDGLSYNQIANELGISVKTIEAQIGKALKILRSKIYTDVHLILIMLQAIHYLKKIFS